VRGGPAPNREREPLPEPPEQILKRRLAQGEISLDEYERLRTVMGEAKTHP